MKYWHHNCSPRNNSIGLPIENKYCHLCGISNEDFKMSTSQSRHEKIISELQFEVSELRSQRLLFLHEIWRLRELNQNLDQKIEINPVHDYQ